VINWFDERVLTLLRQDKVGFLINFCSAYYLV
jgi:hypothetical protein